MTTYLEGVEAPLPEGERVLWQGAPDAARLTLRAFHARKIAIYFGALVIVSALLASDQPSPMAYFLTAGLWLSLSAAVCIGFAAVVARLTARTTLYAITEKRVVMRIGIALPVVINIPLRIIDSLSVQRDRDGRGSLAIRIAGDARVAFLVLWPHARAWRLRHPEPLLRCIANVEEAGTVLRDALLAQQTSSVKTSERKLSVRRPAPVPGTVGSASPRPVRLVREAGA